MTPPCGRAKVCNQGQFCLQGNVGGIWRCFGVMSKLGRRLDVILAFGGWRPPIPLNILQYPPHNKDYLAPNVIVLKARNFAAEKNKPQLDKGIGSGAGMGSSYVCRSKKRRKGGNEVTEGNQTHLLFSQSASSSGVLYSRPEKPSLNPMTHISSSVSPHDMWDCLIPLISWCWTHGFKIQTC